MGQNFIDLLIGQYAVNIEPAICNGQLPYPSVYSVEGRDGGELDAGGGGGGQWRKTHRRGEGSNDLYLQVGS